MGLGRGAWPFVIALGKLGEMRGGEDGESIGEGFFVSLDHAVSRLRGVRMERNLHLHLRVARLCWIERAIIEIKNSTIQEFKMRI